MMTLSNTAPHARRRVFAFVCGWAVACAALIGCSSTPNADPTQLAAARSAKPAPVAPIELEY